MSAREQQFAEVYGAERVAAQREFYETRARSFDSAHRQLLLLSALVFGATAAAGLIAGLDVHGKIVFAVLAAVLPALGTVVAAYDGLYAFERVAKLDRDAVRSLRRVDPPGAAADAVAEYVAEVEHVFTSERGQWGQLMLDSAPPPDGAR